MPWFSRKLTFKEVLIAAPPIYASAVDEHENIESVVFKPRPQDREFMDRQYSHEFISGVGTKESPYQYISAATAVSPHYGVVDLWFKFRNEGDDVYIEVNDWILQVSPEGVTAEDGTFTKLLPES
ncbi:MAG: hypothetical protein WCT26_03805 [Candidatus Buchananbacteria bacterium]|jgi:hypothetical protein